MVITGSPYSDVLGCYKPTGRRLYLGYYETTLDVGAAGAYAVVATQTGQVKQDNASSAPFGGFTVSVYDLRTGRRLRFTPAKPDRVFVSPTGVAAYLYGDRHYGRLFVLDHHGSRLVDEGVGISINSIHLLPGTLHWRHGGALRTTPTAA